MQITRDLVLPGSPARTFAFVGDLAAYPEWMTLVHAVTSVPSAPGDPADTVAWIVELRAQVGPLARSKRLRMVRTIHDPPHHARFERREVDGRAHASWDLSVNLHASSSEEIDAARTDDGATHLAMSLAYGGHLWTGAVLQRILDDEITAGSEALARRVELKP